MLLFLGFVAFGSGIGWIFSGRLALGLGFATVRSIVALILAAYVWEELKHFGCESARCISDPLYPAPLATILLALVFVSPVVSAVALAITIYRTRSPTAS